MLNESDTLYVVQVNGVNMGQPQPSYRLAEATIVHLPQDMQREARVVPISRTGQQLLLG